MARDWTTTGLLATIKRKAYLPDSGGPFTDAELLSMADEALDEMIVPAIEAVRADYYVETEDITTVADQAEYRIPTKATNGTIRDVTWVESGFGGSLAFLPLEDRDYYSESTYPQGYPSGFTLQGDHIVLMPAPSAGGDTLRVRYYRRPSKLVESTNASGTEAAKITGIAGAVYTCDYVPSGWSTSTDVDFISGDPTFESLGDDNTPSSVTTGSGGNVTLSAALDDIEVGDYIALAGESPIPQVPESLHPILAVAVAVEVFVSLGDREQASLLGGKLTVELEKATGRLVPRVHGESKRVANWNSPLRRGVRMRGGWSRW